MPVAILVYTASLHLKGRALNSCKVLALRERRGVLNNCKVIILVVKVLLTKKLLQNRAQLGIFDGYRLV